MRLFLSIMGGIMARRHKRDSARIDELTFAEQAKSITAEINNLQAAIHRHIANSPNPQVTTQKCLAQVDRFQQRLQTRYP
jgi:hypothetical protein